MVHASMELSISVHNRMIHKAGRWMVTKASVDNAINPETIAMFENTFHCRLDDDKKHFIFNNEKSYTWFILKWQNYQP